jgi:hypothetical protein
MKNNTKKSLKILINICFFASVGVCSFQVGAWQAQLWNGEKVKQPTVDNKIYSTTLHDFFPDIKEKYQEGGDFYYRDGVNTFGEKEPFNYQQEVVECQEGEVGFLDAIEQAQQTAISSSTQHSGSGLKYSSVNVGISPSIMNQSIYNALITNGNNHAKGRFCLKRNDPKIIYKNPNDANEVFCEKGVSLSFLDPVSGYSCSVKLDVDLKLNQLRLVRQLQYGADTLGQAYFGCYSNPVTGVAEVQLIENPPNCNDSGGCFKTCQWASDVVCLGELMPRWGNNNECGALPTTIFRGEEIGVSASPALSYINNVQYEGSATLKCVVVGGEDDYHAVWSVTNAQCNASNPTGESDSDEH